MGWPGSLAKPQATFSDNQVMTHSDSGLARRSFLTWLLLTAPGWGNPWMSVAQAGPKDRLLGKNRDRRSSEPGAGAGSVSAVPGTLPDLTQLKASPLSEAVVAAETAFQRISAVPGYVATLHKRELLPGQASPLVQSMQIKLRHQPFSVYLRFTAPQAGREVLFVEGKNRGKLLVHEASGLASWVGTVQLEPTSDRVLAENRYPITLVGLRNGLWQLLTRWSTLKPLEGWQVEIQNEVLVGGVKTRQYAVQQASATPGTAFSRMELNIAPDSELPVRMAGFGPVTGKQPAPLLEEYRYSDLQTQVRLQDADFDQNNRAYGFR